MISFLRDWTFEVNDQLYKIDGVWILEEVYA